MSGCSIDSKKSSCKTTSKSCNTKSSKMTAKETSKSCKNSCSSKLSSVAINKSSKSNPIKKEQITAKPIVKKTITKTNRKGGETLNNKIIKSKGAGSKSITETVKKGGAPSSTKKVIKSEQAKNKILDNIVKDVSTGNRKIKSEDTVKKGTRTVKGNSKEKKTIAKKTATKSNSKALSSPSSTLKKLPVSATSLTARKNAMKCGTKNGGDSNLKTPTRVSRLSYSSTPISSLATKNDVDSDSGATSGGAIGDLIRTPVHLVSSAFRRMTKIFKN